jgi:hypothetical protein
MTSAPFRARTVAVLAWSAISSLPARARGDEAGRARAEALFDQARDLMGSGLFGEACPKLAEAMAIAPSGRAKLALAMCHEGEGVLATALVEFRAALAQATADARADRVALAEAHLRGIEARVSRVSLAAAETPGLVVTVDGAPFAPQSWARGLPLDPGVHTVRATAPKREPWETTVRVGSSGNVANVTVPRLREPTPKPSGDTAAPIAPWIVGGAGILALGVGSYVGVTALAKQSEASPFCHGSVCSQDGVDIVHQARGRALIADVALGVGVVALGVSAFLFLRARGSTEKRAAWLDAATGGLSW